MAHTPYPQHVLDSGDSPLFDVRSHAAVATPGKILVEATHVNTIRDIERRIDARLASDLGAGRMDEAIRRALDEDRNGEARPL